MKTAAALIALLLLPSCNVAPPERPGDAFEAEGGAYASFFSPWERIPETPDASPGASVSQVIGTDTWIRIAYHRPGVRGRDVWTASNPRNGRPVVPRDGDPTPWRAGANEPTTLEVSRDVLVEGRPLPAGKYVLMLIPSDGHWTLVLQDAAASGGASAYDPSLDVLTAELQPRPAPHNEWLAYGFDDTHADGATAWLHWADLKVPFRITLPG